MRKTSVAAYRAIFESGVLSIRRWEAYDALFRLGPMTGQELSKATKIPGMWKRCSELKAAGVAEEVGEKICDVTGENSIIWDVTAYVPSRIEEPASKRASLAARVRQLEVVVADLRQLVSDKPGPRPTRALTKKEDGQLPLFP